MAAVVLAACAALVVRSIPSSSTSPPAAQSASLPADGRSSATLDVATGTLVLTIGVANLGGTLLRVSTPGGTPRPQLRAAGGDSTVRSGQMR